MMCCTRRSKPQFDFEFQNGTIVRAINFRSAVDIIKSTAVRNYDIFKLCEGKWRVVFCEKVFREIEAPTSDQAGRVAGWALYLDRREPVLGRQQKPVY